MAHINKFSLQFLNKLVEKKYIIENNLMQSTFLEAFILAIILGFAVNLALIGEGDDKPNPSDLIILVVCLVVSLILFSIFKKKIRIVTFIGGWIVFFMPVIAAFELKIAIFEKDSDEDRLYIFMFAIMITFYLNCVIRNLTGFFFKIVSNIILQSYFFIRLNENNNSYINIAFAFVFILYVGVFYFEEKNSRKDFLNSYESSLFENKFKEYLSNVEEDPILIIDMNFSSVFIFLFKNTTFFLYYLLFCF